MDIGDDALRLRIYIGESKKWNHRPLYEALVLKARESGLAGATVLRGPMGFGKGSSLHTAKILQLSADLPMIVELIDSEEKIIPFLESIREMMDGGQATLEKVKRVSFAPRA